MSDTQDAARQVAQGYIRNPQDFYGGLVLVAIALFAWWASSDLAGIRGFQFGPGTVPRIFTGLLGLCGLGVMLTGFLWDGPPLQQYAWRGPLFITASIVIFALLVRSTGLVPACFITIMVAAVASPEFKLWQSLIWAAVLTVFCALLFSYALRLSLPLCEGPCRNLMSQVM